MELLDEARLLCPYCGEQIDCLVDTSAGTQRYVEDCSVCCRPIEFQVYIDAGDYRLEVRRDDE
jgi:hypothetical protein